MELGFLEARECQCYARTCDTA